MLIRGSLPDRILSGVLPAALLATALRAWREAVGDEIRDRWSQLREYVGRKLIRNISAMDMLVLTLLNITAPQNEIVTN